ncbi:thiolase-like protein [Catenaria anguillulae PL171]|uniref:beta-ketoacyl-[acyl-carrier-protein] synthase I n=1 Tax=Catenaria anguillulae PL171 TaxID=765915 RepID=A0A1Y2HQ17_9FUNG|nr:thiolase-like protein [Catenaria anguillulae PL171]
MTARNRLANLNLKQVAITGIGLVTPLGTSTASTWHHLLAGHSGIVNLASSHPHAKHLPHRDQLAHLPCHIAGLVPPYPYSNAHSDPAPDADAVASILSQDTLRKSSRFIHHALVAAHEALQDAHWAPTSDTDRFATGVCIGSGIGSIDDFAACASLPFRKLSPFAVPRALVNMAAGWTTLTFGLWGPNLAPASACAAGAHAIADAARLIRCGEASVMLAGASESTINPVSLGGFARAKALCVDSNAHPTRASRPFDSSRAGFVMGEGAGVLVLEDLDHALARGAPRIYGLVAGYGASADAYHVTSPEPTGRGAKRAMQVALQGLPDGYKVGYVNAHATSTEQGDAVELGAIREVLGDDSQVMVSSTKGAMGHLLGAAGAVEAGVAVLSMYHGTVPGTLNLKNVDPAAGNLDLVQEPSRQGVQLDAVLSNSFGFGGTNASLLFTKHSKKREN